MDPENIKLAAQLTSTVVAVVALFLSYRNEKRNQERFQAQLELSRRVAEANIRPLLAITVSDLVDRVAIELTNHGAGTAIVTSIEFSKGERIATALPDLIDIDYEFHWSQFWDIADQVFYVPPRSSEILVDLTAESLEEQGFDVATVEKVMKRVSRQLDDIAIVVTYTDVLGNVIEERQCLTATEPAG